MKAGECAVPRYVSCFGKRSIGLPPGRKKYESRDVCKDRRQGGAVEGVRPEEGGIRRTERSADSACHAAGRDVVAIPVFDGQRFDAYAGTRLGTVNEAVLADIDAGVVAGARDAEHDDVAGTQTAPRNTSSHAGLITADTRHVDAVSGAGPVDETGTVESLGRGRTAGNIGTAELTLGRGGNGGTAGGNTALRAVGRPVGLFSAGGKKEKRRPENQQSKTPEQRRKACRHGDPAGVEKRIIFYVYSIS